MWTTLTTWSNQATSPRHRIPSPQKIAATTDLRYERHTLGVRVPVSTKPGIPPIPHENARNHAYVRWTALTPTTCCSGNLIWAWYKAGGLRVCRWLRILLAISLLLEIQSVTDTMGVEPPVYPIQVNEPPYTVSAQDVFDYRKDSNRADTTHYFTFGNTYEYTLDGATQSFILGQTGTYPSTLNALNRSGMTFDLNGGDRELTNILVRNDGTLKLTGGFAATFSDAAIGDGRTGMGSVWLENSPLTWAPNQFWRYKLNDEGTAYEYVAVDPSELTPTELSQTELSLFNLYGSGTITNGRTYEAPEGVTINRITVEGGISPSYWSLFDETVTTGQTLSLNATQANLVVQMGAESMISPGIFANDADQIAVDGSLNLGDMAYIQPILGQSVRGSLEQTPESVAIVTATQGITWESTPQQYAWADASIQDFGSILAFDDANSFRAPVIYAINTTDPNSLTLDRELIWNGNFLGAIETNRTNQNLKELGTTLNYMIWRGAIDSDYYTDNPFLLNLAEISTHSPDDAAYYMRQFTPEIYATRLTVAAYSGIRSVEPALTQMANLRQAIGYPSHNGSWYATREYGTEKHRNYDPWRASLEGPQTWYVWASPVEQSVSHGGPERRNDPFGYEFQRYGLNMGAMRQIGSVTFGVAGGWQTGDFDSRGTDQSIDTDTWQLTLLASRSVENFFVDAWYGYHRSSDLSIRSVLAGGTLGNPESLRVSSDYTIRGWTGGFLTGACYLVRDMVATPYTGLRFGTAKNATIRENALNLVISPEDVGVWELPVGVRFTKPWQTDDGWVLVPMVSAEYIFRFGNKNHNCIPSTTETICIPTATRFLASSMGICD